MFNQIIAIVFPIAAIVLGGFFYGRFHRPDMRFANELNMNIFVPALVFAALASKSFELITYWKLALGALVVVLCSGLFAWPLARFLNMSPRTLIPPMMFTNSGNMGMPLAVLAFGEQALPAAVVMFMVENTLHYTLGTYFLDRQARISTLWRVPVIAASLAGLAFSVSTFHVWPPLLIAIKLLGDIAIPLLLFSLGVRLTQSTLSQWRLTIVGAIACPLFGMLAAIPMIQTLNLPVDQRGLLLVFGALPPAVLNFVFAEKYQQEPATVASLVMVGNLASLIFIPIALYFALPH
jgi:malate permease and related proteins